MNEKKNVGGAYNVTCRSVRFVANEIAFVNEKFFTTKCFRCSKVIVAKITMKVWEMFSLLEKHWQMKRFSFCAKKKCLQFIYFFVFLKNSFCPSIFTVITKRFRANFWKAVKRSLESNQLQGFLRDVRTIASWKKSVKQLKISRCLKQYSAWNQMNQSERNFVKYSEYFSLKSHLYLSPQK